MAEPNVVYLFDEKEIHVDVLFEEQIVAALPVIRPGSWTVIWKLITSVTPPPIFKLDDGIKIHEEHLPHGLTHEALHRLSDSTVSMVFENQCTSANACDYDINLDPEPVVSQDLKEQKKSKYHHDPTISVVTDPPSL